MIIFTYKISDKFFQFYSHFLNLSQKFQDNIFFPQNLHVKTVLTLFHVGGGEGETPPPHQFFLNIFFCKNRIYLNILDFLSHTYMHPIQFKKYKTFDYSSVDNHPKLTKIGKNG